MLIGLYIGKSGVTESFAAAGSLVVLLAWVYYAAQIFLLGAEFTKVYAGERTGVAAGSDAVAEKTDLTKAEADRAEQQLTGASAQPAAKTIAEVRPYLERETSRLLNRFLTLVVVSAAELVIDRWYKRKRREHEQFRKRIKRSS